MTFEYRDRRRRFTARERAALAIAAGGYCCGCGEPLEPGFHGDHVVPHVRGGRTDVLNGQAFCATCNCAKGATLIPVPAPGDHAACSTVSARPTSTSSGTTYVLSHRRMPARPRSPIRRSRCTLPTYRPIGRSPCPSVAWQRRAVSAVENHQRQAFLIEACPGAGKTIPALKIAHNMISSGRVRRAVIVCPSTYLARQWARVAAEIGLKIEPNWGAGPLPRDCHGIAVTYQRIASGAELYRHGCAQPTMLIADEPHHMGDDASWGRGMMIAFEPAIRWLLLSGTPFRSDDQRIPGVTYNDVGVSQPDFTYGYGEAVRDGICRKIAFVPFDGELSWSSNGTVIDASFSDDLDSRQAAYRHRTAISTSAGKGLHRMLSDADDQLSRVRERGHGDAGGLVVACDIGHAQRIADIMQTICGEPVTIVTSDDPAASHKLKRFRHGSSRWVVAVNMVSEGVDIPRLRVGVYATVAKTQLLFRQIVGRFVRVIKGQPCDVSFLFIPADPILLRLAAEIEAEIAHDIANSTAREPHESEGRAEPQCSSFIALGATVFAQGALLSGLRCAGPEQAAAIDQLARDYGLEPAEVYRRVIGDDAPPLPASPTETDFERRERLRKERHRLVARMHRLTGREYSELQSWVNEAVAQGRAVQEHSVVELEHPSARSKSCAAARQRRERCGMRNGS